MNWFARIRRGEGPFWSRVKWLVKRSLQVHLPVFWLTRPLFSGCYYLHVFIRETWLRLARFFWYEPLFRSQCVQVGKGFQMEALPYIHGSGRITLGDHVRFGGQPVFVFGNRGEQLPEISLGDGTFLGHLVILTCAHEIRIGNHCLIASGVQISDYDGHPLDAQHRRAGNPTPPEHIRRVIIEEDVWIGQSAIILKGVHIGARSIVGAGAVVTRDVPPDVVVAGNPARVVKHLTRPADSSAPS
ncbi:MAG: DapH/DapD/GlmU-related protein [Gemmataceae bacterium]